MTPLISYLVFLIFSISGDLTLAYRYGENELFIADEESLRKLFLSEKKAQWVMSNVLAQVKEVFLNKKEFRDLFKLSGKFGISEYGQVFEDLKNISLIDKDFNNCKVDIQIVGGRIKYMNIEAHTLNKDIQERKSKLGPFHSIETKTEDSGISNLKVTKSYKY